jgi:hypothetical protein
MVSLYTTGKKSVFKERRSNKYLSTMSCYAVIFNSLSLVHLILKLSTFTNRAVKPIQDLYDKKR